MERESSMSFDSFKSKISTTESATSASSAGTSTNTSFSDRSLATSFNSSIGGTDIAKSEPWTNSSVIPLLDYSLPGLQSHIPNRDENDASKVSTGRVVAPPDPMDIDSDSAAYPLPYQPVDSKAQSMNEEGQTKRNTSSPSVGELLAMRLHENPPFSTLSPPLMVCSFGLTSVKIVQVPTHYPSVPLRQLYEIMRVASVCKLDISKFYTCFESKFESYDRLWSSLGSIVKLHGVQVPERSSLIAWDRAGSGFEGVALTGKLQFLDQRKGPCFEFLLNPLKLEHSNRLSRQFGNDRFCVVGLPLLDRAGLPSYLKPQHTSVRETVANWLVDTDHKFLGRTWRAFWTRSDDSKKRGTQNMVKDSHYRVYLFAEHGIGFRDRERCGEVDPRVLDRARVSVTDLLEWFMPFNANLNQSSLKFFARLRLGLT